MLDVFHEGAVAERKTGARLARVEVTRVDAVESAVKVKEGTLPDDAIALPAIISRLEFPPLAVALKGSSLPQDLRRQIERSPYLKLAKDASHAEVVIEAGSKGLRLRHMDSARELVSPDGARSVRWVIEALEKIARWKAVADLANGGDSLASQVQMKKARHSITPKPWIGMPKRGSRKRTWYTVPSGIRAAGVGAGEVGRSSPN